MFHAFAKAIERDKVYYFLLAFNAPCPVVIVNMPSGTTEGKKFLGYEWSNTKGNEGIKYLHVASKNSRDDSENAAEDDTMQQIRGINGIVTPLFNPENLEDTSKINSVIRHNYLGEDFSIPEDCAEYVTLGNLVDMLDFKSVAFKKEIKTNVSLKVEVKSKYPIVKLKDYCEGINPSKEEIRNVSKDTVVSFIEMSSLGFGKIESMEDRTIAELSDGGYTYFKENDVLIAKISPSMENGKCGLAIGLTSGLGLGSTEFHVIRGKNKYQSKFILEYLNREYIRRIATSNETGSSGHRRVPENFYSQMPIPEVPDLVLKNIYDECSELDIEWEQNLVRIDEINKEITKLQNEIQGPLIALKHIVPFSSARIPYTEIAARTYVSTDNMLQDCQGISPYEGKPETESVVSYSEGDILLSNIRPYLRKLWLANQAGGCSPDVLVFHNARPKINDSSFIYYSLRRNEFFDFIMQDVAGMKMPRGRKETIEKYEIHLPQDIALQQEYVVEFKKLDNEITCLLDRIKSIPSRKQAILDKYLI